MIKKINLTHSFIFFIIVNLFIFLNLIFSNFSITPFGCLLLILLIGVTHGSLDRVKGKKLLHHYNIGNTLYFYMTYILYCFFDHNFMAYFSSSTINHFPNCGCLSFWQGRHPIFSTLH
jgi:hypothetical protein